MARQTKSKKPNSNLLIVLLGVVVGLALTLIVFSIVSKNSPPIGLEAYRNVELEVKNIKKSTQYGSTWLEAEVVLTNNTDKTIGTDPNRCDHEIIVNSQVFTPGGCTLIGGRNELKPGKSLEEKLSVSTKDSYGEIKSGDKAFMNYRFTVDANNGDSIYTQLQSKAVRIK